MYVEEADDPFQQPEVIGVQGRLQYSVDRPR